MATTLFAVTNNARKAVIVFIGIAVLIAGLNLLTTVQTSTPTPVGTPGYYMLADGKLGNVSTPSIKGITISNQSTPKYSIEGIFVAEFPDTSYVYKIQKPSRTLTEIQDAKRVAQILGFAQDNFTTEASGTQRACPQEKCIWISTDSTKTLTYEILTKKWKLETDYQSNVDVKRLNFGAGSIETYTSSASSLISSLGFTKAGLSSPLTSVNFADLNLNGEFTLRTNPDRLALINMQRTLRMTDLRAESLWPKTTTQVTPPKVVDKYVYGPDSRVGQVRMIAGNTLRSTLTDLFEFEFINYTYSETNGNFERGSYSIIKPAEAWTRIQQGQGVLVDLQTQGETIFSLKQEGLAVREFIADAFKTDLGFYEPTEWSGFVQPIYIFKGGAILTDGSRANFTYYVDALRRV